MLQQSLRSTNLAKKLAVMDLLKLTVRSLATIDKLPVLTLYTKDDCSLCDKAVAALEPFKHRFKLETVDIKKKENKDWFNKYRYDIPVFHFNGQFLMKHRADLKLFEETLVKFEKDQLTFT